MKIGCMILAGGKSSRMGQDKALLEYAGKKFIECIAAELEFFEEKIIARGNNRIVQNMKELSWTILPDIYPDHGPIGGLHAALKVCKSDALFCVSCDMPLITRGLVKKICDDFLEYSSREGGCDAVIAVTDDGKYHPLCGVYRKELSGIFEEYILRDNNRLMAVLKTCNVQYMNLNEEDSKQLMNVNTKEEYEKLWK